MHPQVLTNALRGQVESLLREADLPGLDHDYWQIAARNIRPVRAYIHGVGKILIKQTAFWFAVTGYFLTFLYYYGPFGIAYNNLLGHVLPYWMCILAIGGMPVPAVAVLIAPVNALLYGIAGTLVAWAFTKLKTKTVSSA